MGLLKFLFGGGNIGLICESICEHHKKHNSFKKVLNIYLDDFSTRAFDPKKSFKIKYALKLIEDGTIHNYRNLAIIALVVDASPPNHLFPEVNSQFGNEIKERLLRGGIDLNSVIGVPTS